MKKIFAILIAAVMLLGLLAGCGNDTSTPTNTTADSVANPTAAGLLVLNTGAALNITYDADGLVMDIEGADDNGSILAGEYSDYLGKSCSEVVCDLIGNSIVQQLLTGDVHYVMIKLALGSSTPGATFIETIQKDAENALTTGGSDAKLVVLTTDRLDENGYIDLDAAKDVALAALALDDFDVLDGTVTPIEGKYNFSITAGSLEGRYIVDAVTGAVYEGELDGATFEDENPDEGLIEDIIDETIEETTPSTSAATEPAVTEPVVTDPVDTDAV